MKKREWRVLNTADTEYYTGTSMPVPHCKHRPAQWRTFPATTTLAFYDTFAQYIELSTVDGQDLVTALRNLTADPKNALSSLPLLFHELRHWLDHMTTVWGRQRMIATFNAMNARKRNQPQEFWRIADYFRNAERDSFGEYYLTIGETNQTGAGKPEWIYDFTCGTRFDLNGRLDPKSPIFFTRFSWTNGKPACRVPFSVVSLLETAAMHTEFGVEDLLVNNMDPVEGLVERNQRGKQRLNGLYDPSLAIYSTAVHSVSNRMQLKNAGDAYPLASALASFCLNIPDGMFDKLIVPNDFKKVWGEHSQSALQNRDRGHAFLLLLFHADKSLVDDPLKWVASAATIAGLPAFNEIANAAKKEREALGTTAIDGPYRERLERLMSIGDSMASSLGISFTFDSIMKLMPEIVFPPVLCSDSKWHSFGHHTQPYVQEAVDKWCWECASLERQINEFMAACGL